MTFLVGRCVWSHLLLALVGGILAFVSLPAMCIRSLPNPRWQMAYLDGHRETV
jgi:hypothetical protein